MIVNFGESEEFPDFPKGMSHRLEVSWIIFDFSSGSLLSLRSQAHAMILIGIRRPWSCGIKEKCERTKKMHS